jgi:hypothetical protein
MSENTITAAATNGTAGANGKASPTQRTDTRTFATEAEARAAGPKAGNEKWKIWIYCGPRGGAPVYYWANGRGMATVRGAEADGATVECLDRPAAAPLTAAKVDDFLGRMSDEDRAILIAKYTQAAPAAGPSPAPAPTSAPAPKGNKGKGGK